MLEPNDLDPIDDENEKKKQKSSRLLKIIAALLAVFIGFFSVVMIRGFNNDNIWEKIIPWTKDNLEENQVNISPSTNIEVNGLVTVNLNNNVSVTFPKEISIYSGYKEDLKLEFNNNSDTKQSVNLKFSGLPYTYVNDETPHYQNQTQQINLPTVTLNSGETKEIDLLLQTTKVWDNYITLYLNEKFQEINLKVTLKDKTPIFGNNFSACATNQPYIIHFGPDCGEGECDGITTDRECIKTAKKSGSNSCRPYQFEYYPDKEDDILSACQNSLQFNTQIARNAPIHSGIMVEEDRYAWQNPDWYIETVSNKINAQQGLASGIMNGDGGWMKTCSECTNPDGSSGFFDINNDYLSGKFRQFVYDLSARYGDKITYYEMANEPAAEFYLCGCGLMGFEAFEYIPENTPYCTATSGPNQPICADRDHAYTQEFADIYGEFLAGSVKIASQELINNNPSAFIVTGAIDDQNRGLAPVTEYMIKQGILDRGNVAIGIHQYPHNGLSAIWSEELVNCTYYQKPDDPWWLPEECEKAPHLADFYKPSADKSITMAELWQEMDNRYDASEILADIQDLGYLDKAYLFDSELHAGYYNVNSKFDLSEAIAGFRIGTINAHQKFLGTIYVLINNNDFSASVYNQMTKVLTGATPVYKWESKLMDSDYSSVVYKLFTRGNEDIIVFWSNDEQQKTISLETKKSLLDNYNQKELIVLNADQGTSNFITDSNYTETFTLSPVSQIKIIFVLREGGTYFDWLTGINY